MFKKATKAELRTWMVVDLLLMIICIFVFAVLLGTFIKTPKKYGALIFAVLLAGLIVAIVIYFLKMVKAFRTYDERFPAEKEAGKAKKSKQK